ncbi:MAG: ribosome small subunit-dependent GTPase A [Gammaproteobacteria bacterium HGW-Gammaproteobacteria-8]|nr:MAG: ribosome small subunit-dependent GTPase A [Gammaproteobacteria bacterium HGW-Gammaproteobacteria-8]
MMPDSTVPAVFDSGQSDSSRDSLRVILALGNHGLAVPDPGTAADDPLELRFRRNVGRPLPGDRVRVDEHGGVNAIEPRHSVFGRGGFRGQFQPVAANLDVLWIVLAPEPAPSVDLLHRYVAAARIQGIEPRIVINKCDLGIPDEAPFTHLDELGVALFRSSTTAAEGIDAIGQSFGDGLHLLAGQSGVGKSSLANALLPDLDLQTERLSRATGKGRHTTTSARLYRTPGGGWLVDTPGVWEYGLWSMERHELARGFPEFAELPPCRFRDCTHRDEPGCAIRQAVDQGRLPESRYQAWLSLLKEQQRIG